MANNIIKFRTRSLTIYYLIALSLIAILNISTYALIKVTISKLESDGLVINLSGRQRMLSQKITKDLLLFVLSETREMKEELRRILHEEAKKWMQVHIGLQNGDAKLQLPGNNSEKVKKLFTDINPTFQKIYDAVFYIIDQKRARSEGKDPYTWLVKNIIDESPNYLTIMDEIVFQYEMEALKKVASLEKKEFYILGAVLSLLLLVVFFIFRPMVKKVSETYLEYQRQNDELHKSIENRIKAEKERETLIENLNKANTDLKEFSHIVSHDLKAPLRGIIMLSKFIEEDCARFMTDECRETFDLLIQNTKRMNRLVEGILHYSHIGHKNVEMILINTESMVRSIISSLLPPENIQVRIAADLPMIVYNQIQLEEDVHLLIQRRIDARGKSFDLNSSPPSVGPLLTGLACDVVPVETL